MISRRLHGASAIFLCIVLSTFCHAQANELSLTLGGMRSSDQSTTLPPLPLPCPIGIANCNLVTTSTSTGFAIEGAFTRRLFGLDALSLGLELPLVEVPGRDVTINSPLLSLVPVTASVSSFFFTPSARVKLMSKAAISPFFSVGGGLVHYGTSASIPGVVSISNGNTNGALQFGGGLDFKTRLPLLRIRAHLRDFYAPSPLHSSSLLLPSTGHQNNLFFGAGVVLGF